MARPGDSSSRYEQILPALIDQVYRTVLCRPADKYGQSNYVNLIGSGKLDLARFVNIAFESPEYVTLIAPAIEAVRAAYRMLFDREPTQAEIYDHVQSFRGSCRTDDEAIALLRTEGAARARLGIRPLKIEMDITNQCNIRCVMCPFSDPVVGGRKRSDLNKDVFARWADEMFSWVASLGLMFGTEPTLNPHLLSFVRTAKAYRVPKVYFSTNGMKLTPELSAGLIEAGLDEMNVSLDGGTKETFERIRRLAKWDVVVRNLKSLRDQKAASRTTLPRLHMSYVLMRSNVQELPRFVELAAEFGAVVLYFTHLVAYDTLGTIGESLGTNLEEFGEYVDKALMLGRQYGIQVVAPRFRQARVDVQLARTEGPQEPAHHLADIDLAREAHGLPRRFATDEAGSCCPFPWHFLAIEPGGSVSPCGWWHRGPPMGNLTTQSFQEIWNGAPMRRLRHQLISRELGPNCSRCPAAGMGTSNSSESFQSR